jgi:hypothetical protein
MVCLALFFAFTQDGVESNSLCFEDDEATEKNSVRAQREEINSCLALMGPQQVCSQAI